MDTLTPAQLKALRKRLDARVGELRAEVQAADEVTRGRNGFRAGEVADLKDEAARVAEDDVQAAEQLRDIDELSDVTAALQRLDSGHYGLCVDCGEPISPARLEVQPSAARCAGCQVAAERLRQPAR